MEDLDSSSSPASRRKGWARREEPFPEESWPGEDEVWKSSSSSNNRERQGPKKVLQEEQAESHHEMTTKRMRMRDRIMERSKLLEGSNFVICQFFVAATSLCKKLSYYFIGYTAAYIFVCTCDFKKTKHILFYSFL